MAELIQTHYEDRTRWLAGRKRGIGASEAPAIIGLSPWMNSMKLWRLKLGTDTPKDLSGNPAVERGNRMEPALRGLYAAEHPEMEVIYEPFDTFAQSDRPWLFATLDGRLLERETGRRGILEIKTASLSGKAAWAEWDGGVKPAYYTQICHQLLATGFEFVHLYAYLTSSMGEYTTLRLYEFERAEMEEDIRYLARKEDEFWKHVENGTLPPMALGI